MNEHLCAYNDHGMLCNSAGTLSLTTLGGGPWYCREHFSRMMGWDQPKPVHNRSLVHIQQEAAKYCAERGLHTVEQMREFVATSLKFGRVLSREPGQEG
jgi:hypothetical protein